MTINLKSVVSKQIPEFAREDYPLFVAFIEAYYEYMDKKSFTIGASGPTYSGGNQQRNLGTIRDIDQTLDEYIQFFKNELDIFGDTYEFIDQKLFLRKVKELFVSKGVEASYKFLFKLLYNKTADISYPWDSVLKASDGKWQQEMSVFVDMATGLATNLPGNKIDILGQNVIIKVYVERVKYIRDNIYEVFIDKDYYGDIQVGYTISFDGITGSIIPTTVSYFVSQPSTGYKVGDLITGTTVSNGIDITQLLKVTKVDENGGVVNIATIRYGCGYDTGFYLLKTNAPITSSSLLTIDKESTQQYSIPNDSSVDQYTDYGYLLSPNYVAVEYNDPSYAGTFLQQFYEESISGQGLDPDYLLIGFNIGAVAKYQGHYNSNDGFLDDDIYIQDSYRWQKFSYLITVDEKLEKYKSLINSYLHPAGTALFGEYQIQNAYNVDATAVQELGQWRSKATFTQINKSIANEYAYPSDLGGSIRINPYNLEEYFAEDYNPDVIIPFYGDGRNNLQSSITITDASPSIVES
ncbi:hypothetical protein EB001_18335 [bacterium]|nr:hypothetical protein [bacterium]